MPEILKKSSKTGDRFTTTSNLQNNVEHVFFQAGNRQLRNSGFRAIQEFFADKQKKYPCPLRPEYFGI